MSRANRRLRRANGGAEPLRYWSVSYRKEEVPDVPQCQQSSVDIRPPQVVKHDRGRPHRPEGPRTAVAHPRRALHEPADHRDGQHHPQRRHPVVDDRPRRQQQPGPVDRRLLRPRVRRAPAHRRQPVRPLRPQRRPADRHRAVRHRLDRRRDVRVGQPTDLHPGLHGHRRRADHARHAVDPHQRLPRPEGTGPGDRHLGRLLRPRRGHRPDGRRPPARALLVAVGVLGEHARSASPPSSSA